MTEDRVEIVRGAEAHDAPAVSVIIPAYKPVWLDDALESIRAQTLRAVEIIVVDDGSPEPVRPARMDDLILVRHANAGPGGARNRGVDMARAPYIAFLDSDDVWLPTKLEKQLASHRGMPESVLSSTEVGALGKIDPRYDMEQSRHKRYGISGTVVPFEQLFYENPISCSSAMVQREAYLRAGGMASRKRIAEEYRLWLRLAVMGPVGYLPEPLVQRRLHGDSLSAQAQRDGTWVDGEYQVYREFLAEHPQFVGQPFVKRTFARIEYQAGYEHLSYHRWGQARSALWRAARHEPASLATWKTLARAYLHVGPRK
jgi:glycosyltransferase involved in cell wall biosynthesis